MDYTVSILIYGLTLIAFCIFQTIRFNQTYNELEIENSYREVLKAHIREE